MRAAIYARVSTLDQEPENQLQELRRYVEARGWTAQEFVDHGVSGTKDRRPALDRLIRDAKRRKVDTVVVWRLDRLGRSLKHLVTLLDELQALGVGFVSLGKGSTCRRPAAVCSCIFWPPWPSLSGLASWSGSRQGFSGPSGRGGHWGDLGGPSHRDNWPRSRGYLPVRPPRS